MELPFAPARRQNRPMRRPALSKPFRFVLIAAFAAALPLVAQEPPAREPTDQAPAASEPLAAQVPPADAGADADADATPVPPELEVLPLALEDGWFEITPLLPDAAAVVEVLGDLEADGDGALLQPRAPEGAAMACTGGRPYGVLCEPIFIVWQPGTAEIVELRFEPGRAVAGRYVLDELPVAGARVAVVPAGLETERPFTLPLRLADAGTRELEREVPTDADGRFALPPLATGEYFLETVLPSGRLHRSDPFDLAAPAVPTPDLPPLDLGTIETADGLSVEFQVTDTFGEPIADALVDARQGRLARTLVQYQAVTGTGGTARLAGFDAGAPVWLRCRKAGFRTHEQTLERVPVVFPCVLEALAAAGGEVLGFDGQPPPGARVAIGPPDAEPREGEAGVRVVPLDGDGTYLFPDLEAGSYRLRAAAPGYGVVSVDFTVEAGERLELEPIVLSAGRELEGRVLDAETRRPVAGARVTVIVPPDAGSATADEDGDFQITVPAEEAVTLRLASPEHVAQEAVLAPETLRSRERRHVFLLARGGTIRAVVWDEATGLPCQGCRLVVRPGGAEIVTDRYGEALSEPLAPGPYRVYRPRIDHLGSTVVEHADAEYRHVRVEPRRTKTVRFGERRDAVHVRFRPALDPTWTLAARGPTRFERYQGEPGGGFRVRLRPGETVDLFVHFWDPAAGAEVAIRQATLAHDPERAEVVLPLHRGTIAGRAVSGERPIAGEPVELRTLQHEPWASTRTRPDGSFHLPHLAPGVYAVAIGDRNVQFLSLRPGESYDLGTLELAPGTY